MFKIENFNNIFPFTANQMLDTFHKPCIVINFAKHFITMGRGSINPFREKYEMVQKL